MKKPIIGITSSQSSQTHQRKANMVLTDYTNSIQQAGGIPLLIPNEYPLENIPDLYGKLDGVLLTGGGDINPELYHFNNDHKSKKIVEERDALERALVDLAVNIDLPLLGICRGHQMINVALGGTLYTDLSDQYHSTTRHDQPNDQLPGYLVHEVSFSPGTKLAEIIGMPVIMVNSRHHQAVRDLAPGLIVTAIADDGLIEGIELPKHRFLIGVQWHPESLQAIAVQQRIFTAFIAVAAG